MGYTFMGYRRPDGTVGTRNYLAVIPSVFCANTTAQKIAAQIPGAVALTLREGALENSWALKTSGELTEVTYCTHVGEYAVALRANWTAPTVLTVEMIYLNYAQHARVEFVFGETGARVLLHETPFGEEYKTRETRELTAVFA